LESDASDIEHVQLHVVEACHAEVRHRGAEVLLALLERDVEGLRTGLDVLVQNREGQRGLHRPRGAGDEDERAPRAATAERFIEAFDVGLEAIRWRAQSSLLTL